MKTKRHEKLLCDAEVPSVRTVRCLPKVARTPATAEKDLKEVLEFTLLISSVDFDVLDGAASASMLAIMKTV